MWTSTSNPLCMRFIFNIFRTLRDFRLSQGYCWGGKYSGVKIFTDGSKNRSAFIFGLDCWTLRMKALRCGSSKRREIFCPSRSLTSHKYCVLEHCYLTYFTLLPVIFGDRGSTVVKVLCYKLEGRWFDSRWCHGIFHWHNPSDRIMALGLTQPLTEMITRRISWG